VHFRPGRGCLFVFFCPLWLAENLRKLAFGFECYPSAVTIDMHCALSMRAAYGTPHLHVAAFLQDIASNVQVALSPEHPSAGQQYSLTLKFDLSQSVRTTLAF